MKTQKRQITKPAGQHWASHNGNHGNNYRSVLGRRKPTGGGGAGG